MSNREKAAALLDSVPEYKLGYVVAFLQGLTADEEADDAFCQQLYERYLSSPDKDEGFSLEECKREWGGLHCAADITRNNITPNLQKVNQH